MKNYIFTSESITEGHPDKICDRIADSILDEALRQDPASKMAVEATIKDDFVLIYGEANTKAKLEYEEIAKEVIREIGYTEEYEVLVKVREQSSEINHAVVQDDGEIGARKEQERGKEEYGEKAQMDAPQSALQNIFTIWKAA